MLIYDIEIRNAIPDGDSTPLPDIIYCEGWRDFKGMGIAVIRIIRKGTLIDPHNSERRLSIRRPGAHI